MSQFPEEVPIILTESFANSQSGQALWTKYKKKIYSAKPLDFAEIRADLRMFLMSCAELARNLDE